MVINAIVYTELESTTPCRKERGNLIFDVWDAYMRVCKDTMIPYQPHPKKWPDV